MPKKPKIGTRQLAVAIRNPAERDRVCQGEFLVDTGATDCLVPRAALKSIGLQPEGKRSYKLADGSKIQFDVDVAEVEFMGDFVGSTILFGDDDAEPLLGVTALESMGVGGRPAQPNVETIAGGAAEGYRPA